MAKTKWTKNKVNPDNINSGNEYTVIDQVSIESLNAIVNNSLYSSDKADSAYEKAMGTLNVGNVTSESVASSQQPVVSITSRYNKQEDKTYADFDFKIPKGEKGLDGSGINPNLLINGDFRVNQRNQELYTATGTSWLYTADRWRMYNANNTFNATTKTIRLKGTTTFEQSLEEYKSLAGRTVTLSAKINTLNGSAFKLFIVKGGIGEVVGNVISSTGIVSFTTTINENITSLRVGIKNTSSDTATFNEIGVDYFKLEIGSVATAFSPRPYAEELALCQRYYFKLLQTNAVLTGFAFSTTEARSFFNFPSEMRISPTFTLSQGASSCKIYQGSILTPSAVSVHSFNKTGVNISFISSGLTINMPLACRFLQIVEFDAEIY